MSGRGTSGGVLFQSEVGAYVAALLLSERPISRLGDNLPGKPHKIFMEAPSAVDDVNVITDKGLLYFQAKSSLSLSESEDSELFSVIDQFVRQFRLGVPEGSITREMDVTRDRLILAISESAPATVKNDLREVLTKNRTGAATALPKNLQNALNAITKLIAAAWLKEEKKVITPAKTQAILKLCSVVILDQSQKILATEALRDVVTVKDEETTLSGLLVTWATEASRDGTGGDEGAIRLYMQGRITLKEPLSYQSDVSKLTSYSNKVLRRLERFTKITTDAGEVTFSRTVSTVVINAARDGSLAITGDPGSGKSGIMHALATELQKDAFVITLTVESNINTLKTLQDEIGLDHPLVDVCRTISLTNNGYLILDALDATRGGLAERTYKKLIDEVSSLPNWQVVASVRTFDLKLGLEWRKLFRGNPPDLTFSEPSFQIVRHVHVPLLGAEEIQEIEGKSSSLKIALAAGGGKMAALAKNPFNLSLIGEILSGGVSPESLSNVNTRLELLSRYWTERLDDLGLPGTVAMRNFVNLLLTARSVDVPETEISQDASVVIQELHARGVLVTEQTRRIAFRHHILFDFAVSRLILEPDQVKGITRLSRAEGAGLLIAPSLEYWIEHLRKHLSAEEYWKLIASLISAEETDPIIRVEVARIAVVNVVEGEDLAPLSKVMSDSSPVYNRAIIHMAGTLGTFDVTVGNKESWARMASKISNITEYYQLGSLKIIAHILLKDVVDGNSLIYLGELSRTLFDAMSKEERLIHWLSSSVIPLVAKTYASDPKASKERLEQIFSAERFKKLGYIELPALAEEAVALADQDDELIAMLYRRVFAGGEFSQEHKTSLGSQSWILNLTSNAAQDFGMAEYALSTDFPKILERAPKSGIRAFGAALDEKYSRRLTEPVHQYQVSFQDKDRTFVEDNSALWAWDIDSGKDHEDKVFQSFISWIASAAEDVISTVPELLLHESNKGLIWRSLFDAGAKRPELLGKIMWNSATDPVILSAMSTRRSAIRMIAETYPHQCEEERSKIEAKLMAYDFAHTRDPESFLKHTIATVFNAIGVDQLVSDEAKDFLKKALEENEEVSNSKPMEFGHEWSSATIQEVIKTYDSEEAVAIAGATDSLRSITEKSDADLKHELWPAIGHLSKLMDIATLPLSEELASGAAVILAKSLRKSLMADLIPYDEVDASVARLLDLSNHLSPVVHSETETDFERFPSWSEPAVRIEVAGELAGLISLQNIWPKIRHRYEELLLTDPHPAVRMQSVLKLSGLWDHDRTAMFELAKKFVDTEMNKAVLGYGSHELARFRTVAAEEVEPLFLKLSQKSVSSLGNEDYAPATLAYFAVARGFAASKSILGSWIANFADHEKQLHSILFNLRGYFCAGYLAEEIEHEVNRKNGISFLWELIAELEPYVKAWPTDREATFQEITALKLFNEIGDQLYYSIGYDDTSLRFSRGEKQALLTEYTPLISKLTTLGTPKTVHHCLEVLEKFIETDPIQCFDLFSEAMLRKTGVAKYEYEPMGAKLFVKFVGLYIADHRAIFVDEQRRRQLIDCLSVFVEAGWPEARRLFQTLPELR